MREILFDKKNKILFLDGVYDPLVSHHPGIIKIKQDENHFIVQDSSYYFDIPLYLIHLRTKTRSDFKLSCKIQIEKGVELDVIQAHLNFTNLLLNSDEEFIWELGAESHVHHLNIVDGGEMEKIVSRNTQELAAGAILRSLSIYAETAMLDYQNKINIAGEGAKVFVSDLAIGKGSEEQKFNWQIHHNASYSDSRQMFKGFYFENAKGNSETLVYMDSKIKDATADQQSRGILLGENSSYQSKPILEVCSDEVSATHGATVSTLSEDEIFYFTTRGIGPVKARAMIVSGEMNDLCDKIEVPLLIMHAKEYLQQKLSSLDLGSIA